LRLIESRVPSLRQAGQRIGILLGDASKEV
jgi:hypothetical protein